MKHCAWISIAILFLSAAATAQVLPDSPQPATSGSRDWIRVQDLERGEEITVARPGGFAVPCVFAGATDDTLYCDSRFSDREYRFDRTEIERVRRDDKRRNFHILIGSFAAAGFIWGVATPPGVNGTPRALSGLAAAAAGGLVGCVVALPAAFLIPGRLVYRRTDTDRQTRSSATAGQAPPSAEENR